nr:calcium/calmodulin-dependent protein kinase type IV-like [Procambarus clarkii]
MREVLEMAKGTPGEAAGLKGFLSLHDHPDLNDIFHTGNIEDDYDVEKEPIARGKFGAVRRARHRATGQVFAAKYVRRRRRNVSLEDEARHEVAVLVLGRRDPHIVSLHHVYETRTEYIILLEFAGGGDLQRLLDEAVSLPECEVRGLLKQVLRGLAFLHSQSIAHLDIKPQNLVMMGDSPDAGVKLVDFGLSRVIAPGAEIKQIMGTPDYVAPEVINFEPVNLYTDMWAVGVLTYVFLTGCTPFGGDTDQETFVNITQAEFDFPEELFSDISEQAKDFICGLLVKKPSDRMTVDDCLSHTWMTTPLPPLRPSVSTESYENQEEESTNYHVFDSCDYRSSFPASNEHLYPLPETDHADSAYSSDSSSSPTFTEGYSSLVVPPLCHCTIPEEQHQQLQQQQQQQQHQKHGRPQMAMSSISMLARRQRNKGHHFSVDMEETLRSLRQHQPVRATRRASLVLDDPRYLHQAAQHLHDIVRPVAEVQRPLIEEGVLTRDSDVDSGVSCHDCEESRVESQRLCHSESYDGGDAASVVSWDDYADLGGRRPSVNQFDPATLCSVTKPWEKLCNGSVSRAITQLTVKKVPNNSDLRSSKTDLRGSKVDLRGSRNDLHASKSDLRASKVDLRASKLDLRASKSDLRGSKSDIRASKSDLRASKADLRASRQDLRASKPDLRASRPDLRASRPDLRASRPDLRASKSDLRASKSDLRASKSDLRASRTDLRGSRTNLTLSRLDLAHETLDNECVVEDEGEDVLRCDLTLPRRKNIDMSALAPFMRGNSLHMSFRTPKRRDMNI